MNKLKYIRVQEQDNSYSNDIPIGVDAQNVDMRNGNTLQDTIGNLDVTVDDNITEQLFQLHQDINQLDTNKLNKSDVNNYVPSVVTNWLNTNVNPAGSAVTIDKSLSIENSAADAKAVGDLKKSLEIVYAGDINRSSRWGYINVEFKNGYDYAISVKSEASSDITSLRITKNSTLNSTDIIDQFNINSDSADIIYHCESTEANYFIIIYPSDVTTFSAFVSIIKKDSFKLWKRDISNLSSRVELLQILFSQNAVPIIEDETGGKKITFTTNSADVTMFGYRIEDDSVKLILIKPTEYGELVDTKKYAFHLTSTNMFLCATIIDNESATQLCVKSAQTLVSNDLILAAYYPSDKIAPLSGILIDKINIYESRKKTDKISNLSSRVKLLQIIFSQNATPIVEDETGGKKITFTTNSANNTLFGYGIADDDSVKFIYIKPTEHGELVDTKKYAFHLTSTNMFLCATIVDDVTTAQICVKTEQTLASNDLILAAYYPNDKIAPLSGILIDKINIYENKKKTERISNLSSHVELLQIIFSQNATPIVEDETGGKKITFTTNSADITLFGHRIADDNSIKVLYIKPTEYGELVDTKKYTFHLTSTNMFLCVTIVDNESIAQICVKTTQALTSNDLILAAYYPNDKIAPLSGILIDKINIYDNKKKIESLIEDTTEVPSYAKDYLDERANKALKSIANNGSNSDSFIFYTDTHFPSNFGKSGLYMSYIIGKTPINKVFYGGDVCPAYSSSYPGKTTEEACLLSIADQFKNINNKIISKSYLFQMKGNHDFHVSNQSDSSDRYIRNPQQSRNVIMNGSSLQNLVTDLFNTEACYYYVDNPSQKIRYICLDPCEEFGRNNRWWSTSDYGISSRQLQWVYTNAVLTALDYNFIFITHVPFVDVVTTVNVSSLSVYSNLKSFIEGLNSHSSITISGNQYDFSSATGKVMLVLAGHEHEDLMTYNNGILHVSIACDANYKDYTRSTIYQHFNDIPETKTKGTIYEQTFDIVNVDCESEMIKFLRVGGGVDRYFHTNALRVNSGSTLSITPTISGSLSWWCYDGDGRTVNDYIITPNTTRASISNGVVTGISSGDVVVVCKNENKEYEFFNVIVS